MSIRTLNALRKIATEYTAQTGPVSRALRSIIGNPRTAPGSVLRAAQELPASTRAQLTRAMRPQGVVSNYETGEYPTGGFADTMRWIYDGTFGRALFGKSNPYPNTKVYSNPNYGELNPFKRMINAGRDIIRQGGGWTRGLGAASGPPGITGR